MTAGRGLLYVLLVFGLLCALAARQERQPLLIDAGMHKAGGDWCDVPAARPPLLRPPGYIIGRPHQDGGIA